MTKLRAALSVLALALLSVWFLAVPASADSGAPITRYDVTVNLTPEGVAQVSTEFTMDFGVVSGRGPYLLLPTVQDDGSNPDEQFVFRYSNIHVSSSTGAATTLSREESGGILSLRIGDEDRINTTPQTYTVTYDLEGVIVSDQPQSGLDELNWDVIGPGWTSSFTDVSVHVSGPAAVQRTACFYGQGYASECTASSSADTATFTVASLSPGEPMQVVAGFPAGTFGGVEQIKQKKPSLANAFSLTPASGAVAGGGLIAAIAGLVAIRRRHGRDDVYLGLTPGLTPTEGDAARIGRASRRNPVAVAFAPPKGTTPGEIGTLLDTTADNVDVSATLVDLAVRGFLRINSDGGKKFALYATVAPPGQQLAPFEEQLLADVFQGAPSVTSKTMRGVSHENVLPNARRNLYNAVVSKGWFKSNPVTAQALPMFGGMVLLIVGIGVSLLLSGLGWSLVGIPVAVFGVGLMVLSRSFRRRTAEGSAYLTQAKGFELYLRTAERDTLRFEEKEDIFSKYLPYAMVFGVADRWTKLFAQMGADGFYQANTSWYVGSDLMHGMAFANAMNNLTAGMSSAMEAARAAGVSASTAGSSGGSGFSGGGGFGGGGGGSW